MAKITLDQLQKKLRNLKKCINTDQVVIPALKLAEGLMKRRVFNNGLAADGSKIGRYISNWKNERQSRGRQVNYVDLSFEGNLLKSIQVGKSEGKNVLGFANAKQRIIARSNENYRGKEIFKQSDQNRDLMLKSVSRGISKSIKQCFK